MFGLQRVPKFWTGITPTKNSTTQKLAAGQSASLVPQGEVKRGSLYLKPKAPPSRGAGALAFGPEFFTFLVPGLWAVYCPGAFR